MRPDEKRPEGGGNLQRAYDEAAPSESITASVPPDHYRHQDAPGPSTRQEREERQRRARRRLREADERRRVGRALSVKCADLSEPDASGAFAPSEGWLRKFGNDLASAWGFDPAYLMRRYGLTRRTGANA